MVMQLGSRLVAAIYKQGSRSSEVVIERGSTVFHQDVHRRRNMVKVREAKDIIACENIWPRPHFRSNHAHFAQTRQCGVPKCIHVSCRTVILGLAQGLP